MVLECGHVGNRKSIEITRYFKDYDVINVYLSALNMPRSKKKSDTVKIVKKISYEEYLKGKLLENENLYLKTVS